MCPRTGGSLALDCLVANDDGDVEYGVLTGPAGTYPVLQGIPVFVPTPPEVVQALRDHRYVEAVAIAAFGALPVRRRERLLAALGSLPVGGPFLRRVTERARQVPGRSALGPFATSGTTKDAQVLDPLRRAYLDSSSQSIDAFNYFAYRYGMPRHLVALSAIEASLPVDGPILDIGCGAGHLTWAIDQRSDMPLVGVERELFLLLVARQLAPNATFLCADARSLPFPTGWARLAVAFDVLSFVTDKLSFVREVDRVLSDDGRLVFTSVKNARTRHVHAGDPLTPSAWQELVAPRPTRLLADSSILERYLSGRGLPAARQPDAAVLAHAPTLTMVAEKGRPRFDDAPAFTEPPHGLGPLGVNPLFHPVREVDGGVELARRFPSAAYIADNPGLERYLPERAFVSDRVVQEIGRGVRSAELDGLIRSLVVLALPAAFPGERWPRPRERA